MRAVLAWVLVALVAFGAFVGQRVHAQAAPAQLPASDLVWLDAIVTDARGARVADLKPEDFQVIEDGAARVIEGVRPMAARQAGTPEEGLVPISTRADERLAAERDGARLFAIFVDEYHITAGPSAARTREALERFIDLLGPRDLVLLAKPLDSLVGLRLTRDRDALRRAIGLFEGRKGDYRPQSDFERNAVAGTPDRIEEIRSQIVISALTGLAIHLDGLGAGRKSIVVVSEGFARPRQHRDGGLPTVDSVVRAANQAAAAIYPIDPRAVAANPVDPVRPVSSVAPVNAVADDPASALLRSLANDTSGWAALNAGDLDAGLQRVLSDAGDYYLVAFKPAGGAGGGDGRFHPVELRVGRPNVTVRARKGYWSPRLEDSSSPARPAARPPARLTRASPLIRPWFGIARGSDGNMQISFVWEPAARVPGDRAFAAVPSTVVMRATTEGGETVYDGTEGPSSSEAIFQTRPGRLRVELAIRDANSRLLDTDVRDVIVGALAGPVELGTAEIIRSRTAREYRAVESNPGATPTASREFSRAERLLIRVPVYGAGDGMQVTASLQNMQGKPMRDLAVTLAPAPGEYQVDLPLAGLASSDYVVAIAARSSAGKADSAVTFRVTP